MSNQANTLMIEKMIPYNRISQVNERKKTDNSKISCARSHSLNKTECKFKRLFDANKKRVAVSNEMAIHTHTSSVVR